MPLIPATRATDLIPNGPGTSGLLWRVSTLLQPFISHSAAEGALPDLVRGDLATGGAGRLLWPEPVLRAEGTAGAGEDHAAGRDEAAAARLWDVSAALTGVSFDQFATAA